MANDDLKGQDSSNLYNPGFGPAPERRSKVLMDSDDISPDAKQTLGDYLKEIISSFKETSKNEFNFNFEQDAHSKKITKSIEIVYGLRNFIGNANKFCKSKIYINLRSSTENTIVTIQQEPQGYPTEKQSKKPQPKQKSTHKKTR